ncbi:MAG TPA: DUF1206 domain-containing protein [Acidimicrobiales bacterium]|nr:DUF1206 domain-containing protein [Acidimicrobiales bacterium]
MRTASTGLTLAHRLPRRAIGHAAAVEVAARAGWSARAALYLLVGLLASRIARARGGGAEADRSGALATIAESRFGTVLLVAITVGFVGFAVWRAIGALRGGDEKVTRRLSWAGTALVYGALAALAGGVVLGGEQGGGATGEGGDSQQAATARLLEWPGGRLLLGVIGLAILAVAAHAVRKGVKERFQRDIDEAAVPERLRPAVSVIGVAGWLGRALAWALSGFFVVRAAVQHDPSEPVGLDRSLRALVDEPWGPTVVWVAVAGLLAYGLLCAVTAIWPDPEPGD